MNICWVQHASEWSMTISIAKALEEKGVGSFFVCKTKTAFDMHRERGCKAFSTIETILAEHTFSPSELAEADQRYGPPGIKSLCESDIYLTFLFGNDENAKKQLVVRMYRYWERFFDEHTITMVVARETAQLLSRTACNVARKRNIPFSVMSYGPAPHTFTLSHGGEFPLWKAWMQEIERGPRPLTEEEKSRVLAYIKIRTPDSSKRMTMRFIPSSLYSSLRKYFGYIWYDRNSKRRTDPFYIAAIRYGKYRLLKQLMWKYITQLFLQYAVPNEHEKFVYFPLYSGLETSYLAHTPFWAYHEVDLIKEVASSLPEGVLLYIKEHPMNPGDLTYRELKQLRKIPNVRIMQPHVSSQFLIEKSQLVVTIEGTAGWEAFITKHPVLCLAETSLYAHSQCVYKAYDVSELEGKLWEALRKGREIYTEKEEEWLWFINAVISTVHTGDVVRLEPPYGFPDDKENAQLIADAIILEAREIKKVT